MGPAWGPPGSCRPQMGPMLAPWTLLSGYMWPYILKMYLIVVLLQAACTIYPMYYGWGRNMFVWLWLHHGFLVDLCVLFVHILQGYRTGKNVCIRASEVTLKDMGEINHYPNTTKQYKVYIIPRVSLQWHHNNSFQITDNLTVCLTANRSWQR